jgi:lipoprotein LprG
VGSVVPGEPPVAVWQAAHVRARDLPTLAAVAVTALLVASCSGGGAEEDPQVLLDRADETLAATQSVHFVLSSTDVPDGVTAVVAGEGDAARPDSFAGDLDVVLAGVAATVAVVSTGRVLYAQLPFTTGFTETDPAQIGITDPGTLLAEEAADPPILGAATGATDEGESRVGDVVVRQVGAIIPASAVGPVLGTADEAADFDALLGIDPETGQLLRAELTGPFLATDTPTSYTIELSDYDAPVEITVPVT